MKYEPGRDAADEYFDMAKTELKQNISDLFHAMLPLTDDQTEPKLIAWHNKMEALLTENGLNPFCNQGNWTLDDLIRVLMDRQ